MPVSPRPEDFPVERARAFGARLAQARKAAGYGSQTALAREALLHPLTVHKHERQGFMPCRSVLRIYSRLLGVSEAWLLYGSDDPLLDLPEVVRDYLLGPHGKSLSPPVYERLMRIPWDLLTGDYIDPPMVHELRLLVEKNLAMTPQSADGSTAPLRAPVQLHLPRVHQRPRRGALTA